MNKPLLLFPILALVVGGIAYAEDDLKETQLAYTAREALPLEFVDSVFQRGGEGQVLIRRAAAYSVTVVSGESKTEISINENGVLEIGCVRSCSKRDKRVVHVEGPSFRGVTVFSKGLVVVDDGFEIQDDFYAYVLRGGVIEALNLKARNVSATVVLGGRVEVTALETLKATVNGATAIVAYDGDPIVEAKKERGGKVISITQSQ